MDSLVDCANNLSIKESETKVSALFIVRRTREKLTKRFYLNKLKLVQNGGTHMCVMCVSKDKKGWQPLDLDAEIERQLKELVEKAKDNFVRRLELRMELRRIGR